MEQTEKKTTEETTISTPDPTSGVQIHRTVRSFLLSKKLWMTLFAIVVLWAAYWKEIDYLYSFTDPNQITAFVSLTRDFMIAFTAVVLAFCGIEGVVSWKHGTESVVNQAASFVRETREEHLTHDINQNIVEEGADGAPEARPFSTLATHEEGLEE